MSGAKRTGIADGRLQAAAACMVLLASAVVLMRGHIRQRAHYPGIRTKTIRVPIRWALASERLRPWATLKHAGSVVWCGPAHRLVIQVPGGRRLYDAATRRLAPGPTLRGSEDDSIVCSPDGRKLYDFTDRSVSCCDTRTGGRQFDRPADLRFSDICSIVVSQNGQWIATGGHKAPLTIWDARTGRALVTLGGEADWPHDVAFTRDSQQVFAAYPDEIAGWSTRNWSPEETLSWDDNSPSGWRGFVRSMDVGASGHHIAFGTDGDDKVRLWDLRTGQVVRVLRGSGKDGAPSVTHDPAGTVWVSGNADGRLRVWDARSGRLLQTAPAFAGKVESARFSPDGRFLAASDENGVLKLWKVIGR